MDGGKLTRDELHHADPSSPHVKRLAYNHLANVVLRNDGKRARRLLLVCPHALRHLLLCECGRVELQNPVRFAEDFRAAHSGALDEERSLAEQKTSERASVRRQKERVHWLAQLWCPFSARLTLVALRLEDGTLAAGPEAVATGLAQFWAVTFERGHRLFPQALARGFLETWAPRFPVVERPPPSKASYERPMRRQTDNGPGPDGVPYSGWGATPEESATTLWRVGNKLASGVLPDPAFNASWVACPPKGDEEGDAEGAIREPKDTRPLGRQR